MGMTIDNHIEVLKSYHHGFTGCAGNLQDSIDVAVDIMRKYQKIKHILKYDWDNGYQNSETISRLKEVIEDGNDD